jgi:uncharacterized pyridoxamine 5'-phosphate oxidase family protein
MMQVHYRPLEHSRNEVNEQKKQRLGRRQRSNMWMGRRNIPKRLMISAAFIIVILGLMLIISRENENGKDKEMTNLEFFQSLDYEDGLNTVVQILNRFPVQYAATLGQDGNPQVRPIEFKFEENGVLYFDTVTYYDSYAELREHPYIQLCVCDSETMTYIRLGGKVNFTDDEEVINRCFEESTILTSQFGSNRDVVIGYYLTEVWAEFRSFSEGLSGRTYSLKNMYDTDVTKE